MPLLHETISLQSQQSRMTRPTDFNNMERRYERHRREGGVYSREPSSDIIDVDDDDARNKQDVIIVVRDRKNLSLALRKLQCCSQCFSPRHECDCQKSRRNTQESTLSVISAGDTINNAARHCNKCKVGPRMCHLMANTYANIFKMTYFHSPLSLRF